MKALKNIALLSTSLVFLGGCTVFNSFSEVEALNEAQTVGSPFTQVLAGEYRKFANSELKEMFDYPDALHFARKGLAAAAGQVVAPEPVSDWNLSPEHLRELSAARGRLMIAFDLGAREREPSVAAIAQARFDCWIEQQEEDWQSEDIAACRDEFLSTISVVEGRLQPPPQQEIEQTVSAFDVDASQPMEVQNAMYLTFFNWDSAQLSNAALNVLDAVAQEISANPPAQVNVVGHADTSGTRTHNQRLALKRANAVKDALVDRGVTPEMIAVDAKGEDELLVQTADGVREPANRRVNITFQ